MENYKIEKGIPIPQKLGRNPLWPFSQMEIKDSVFIPIEPYERKNHSLIMNAARNAGNKKNPKWKFCSRRVEGGIRVWRIE
jgi:hypothetical protein